MINQKDNIESGSHKELVVFQTFDDAANENYRWLASLSPEQHLSNAVKLIKRLYKKEIEENSETKISFILEY